MHPASGFGPGMVVSGQDHAAQRQAEQQHEDDERRMLHGRHGPGRGDVDHAVEGRQDQDGDALSLFGLAGRHGRVPYLALQRDGPAEFGAGRVLLKPAAPGTGVIAGGAVRSVMEAAGITNIRAKCMRSKNPQNVVKATFNGLMALRGPEEVARIRGKSVEEILG